MAKKQNQKDPTGVMFDTRFKAVMAQGGSNDNIKEKISAVRAIVPNRSNNEIILVLQHYDNCVDRTVQAFMEGCAADILKEWSVTGKKKNKKKKVKPKAEVKTEPEQLQSTNADNKCAVNSGELSTISWEKDEVNSYHVNGSVNDESVDSLSEQLDALSVDAQELEDSELMTPDSDSIMESVTEDEKCKAESKFQPRHFHSSHSTKTYQQKNTAKSRSRAPPGSQTSTSLSLVMPDDGGFISSKNKKIGTNIEKSAKDLQRCTVSLARYRAVIKEEMDISIRKMKLAFAELQNCFMDREVALLGEMDKVKAAALDILDSRQKRAEALKKMTDNAVRMSEEQLMELRADIKHFVSERKYDEDLGRCAQFTCDVEELKASIQAFGQVSHPKNNYSARSRCSSVSSVSVTSRSDVSAPDCISDLSLTKSVKNSPCSGDISTASANSANQTCLSNRPVPHGNRRAGYRPGENRINGPSHFGRNEYRNRYRNGPKNYSDIRYNPQSSARGFNTDKSQTSNTRYKPQPAPCDSATDGSQICSTASNDTAVSSDPSQSSLPPVPANALSQRRPKSSGNKTSVNC
ncbi:spermatogenesis-associated serine-rich protein 2-like isoform X1 [Hemiscyllium ocellatum]|uniref:spermatogenesis-associated serine-rich protein 2-like isoform X1 n=2 Tax=Hemiscyllium ocellatum TaxID=170820 RepID=UPI0029669F6C|nr:spermatogenesis-associated serine-rich protein 2-like isoform X1 [Hemiscyllium ocellatum]XP_060677144.1 spermatogenesis-associated serine-rich protein 2-like isoform X1 [Hemiscyllium ocellatum]XP_060677145.1 spermatogenesis-associated serine-rich protein 2-like isoform X1 [Hemiscyllium ocellatum]